AMAPAIYLCPAMAPAIYLCPAMDLAIHPSSAGPTNPRTSCTRVIFDSDPNCRVHPLIWRIQTQSGR
ncbi:MAG: hypothetical protein QM234_08570, partial [Acidobacteriota bacterium]|nr:hypothetical protein [Acidobacteriota bacterium]